MANKKIRVNIVSESEISVQGHGVHTAYEEMAHSLEAREDVEVIRGHFGEKVPCDIIHIHTVGPRTYSKLIQKGPKKVISAHVVPDSFIGSLLFAKAWRPLAVAYLRKFYNQADLLLAVSDETVADLKKLKVKPRIEILYNTIDTSRYKKPTRSREEIREKLGIAKGAFVVIGAGQVQPRKRVSDMLAVAKRMPDVRFVWIGGMPFGGLAADNARMKRMMESAPANVKFAGIVALEEMPNYYHAADAFWLPSIQETFGLVVVEAAASGLPIILRDIPDYDATFKDDALRPKDQEEYIKTIDQLKDDPTFYKKWKAGAERIAQRFDSKAGAERLVALYRDLL